MQLLLLIPAIGVIYWVFKSRAPSRRDAAAAPLRKHVLAPPASAPACHWQDGGRYATEVVVESAFQGVIRALAGEPGERGADAPFPAVLVPDDLNAYDDKAVAVFVAGQLVGYLAREDALNLRRKLGRGGMAGLPTSCDARVRGGGLWQGKRLSYNVVLDIPSFD
ncbi:hypothetical protein [Janthinobacterium fluminis]|uniref:HIRAN domain-containing protein n=1 Tax=Janthinobacterium fluminis TaxID=2987524 RepID=A0ABT5JV90_9BURK|nr:hypothetical protein [Janthinobacterium fluminis]MDC8756330.1 hypothetical protein [Janthinobacterium fluminis]